MSPRVLPAERVEPERPGWCAGDREGWRLIDEPGPVVVSSVADFVEAFGPPPGDGLDFDPLP